MPETDADHDDQTTGSTPSSRSTATRRRAPRPTRPGRAAARERIRHQHTWVDLQIRQAMERGEFDRLPGAGKPIEGLGAEHDPEWWLKGLIERERIAVLPASLSLRKEDAELDDRLDTIHVEARRAARGRGVQRPGDPGPVPPARGTAADHHAARRRGDGRRPGARVVRRGPRPGAPPARPSSPTPAAAALAASGAAPGRRRWWPGAVPAGLSRRWEIAHTDRERSAARFRPMRSAKDFFRPLAVGAPTPLTEIPARPSRAIHFFDPSNAKMAAKIPQMVGHRRRAARQPRGRRQGRQQARRPRGPGPDRAGHRRPRRPRRHHPALDARQRPRQPVGPRRPDHAGHRDRRPARRDHGAQGAGRRGHPLRRPAARPARGQGRAGAADPRARDPRDRPRHGQHRGDLRRLARACRASPWARPTWPPTGG